ncbi:hypothetical protein ACHMW6_15895 [Pseudoduganella sp. UC29_106]|uniref:hypothetical protein n=1 Tax=Pseudoduganella sp. UC29_106 TaxID=3374553 RepID=UPI003757D6ED
MQQAAGVAVVRIALAQHHQVGVARLQAQAGVLVLFAPALLGIARAEARCNFAEKRERFVGPLRGEAQVVGNDHAAAFEHAAGIHIAGHAGHGGAHEVGLLLLGQSGGQLDAFGRIGGFVHMNQDGTVSHDFLLWLMQSG